MKKLFALLLVAQVGLGFGQDAVDSAKEVADQASSVSEKLQDSEYVDIAPRVGFKINIGTVATLGESAIGEAGFVLSPTILATMNFNKSTFMTGEMAMSNIFVPTSESVILNLTMIDPTLVFGYNFTEKVSIYAGPQYNLILNATETDDDEENDILDDTQATISLVTGLRMNYGKDFFSDLRFQYGLTEYVKDSGTTLYSAKIGGGLYF